MGAPSLLDAGPMVQAVLLLLLLGSIASWAIIIHRSTALWGFSRDISRVERFAGTTGQGVDGAPRLLADLLTARDAEAGGPGLDSQTARAAAMRSVFLETLRRHEGGLPFLATLAATAPFIGLFGTVWGIMRSFAAISQSNDTSLAVVAPGIAEALFATAMGLAAAIPAVVAYNLLRAHLRRCGQRLGAAVTRLAKGQATTGRIA